MHRTDKEWEKWGKIDPYYGVITSEEYRGTHLTADMRTAFFETGRQHVDHVLATIRKHLDPEFSPRRVLDFGCGTGRVLIPIAKMCDEALGIDVSDSMLSECLANCEGASVNNVTLRKSDDLLTALSGQYDLVHSFIVFQHIPKSRGEKMIPILIEHLSDNGIAVLHFALQWDASLLERVGYFLRHRVPLAHPVMNWLQHNRVSDPKMEMNLYDMNRILSAVNNAGVKSIYIELVRHGAHNGAVLYLSKKGKAQPEN